MVVTLSHFWSGLCSIAVILKKCSHEGFSTNHPAFSTESLPGQPTNAESITLFTSKNWSMLTKGMRSASKSWIASYSVCCHAHSL